VANSIWQMRRATTAEVIAHTRVTRDFRPLAPVHPREEDD
jgi:hypothetical protein